LFGGFGTGSGAVLGGILIDWFLADDIRALFQLT